MGSDELTEWMAHERLEPFGSEVEAFRFAQLCSVTANAFRGKKGRRARPRDFMPKNRSALPDAEGLWRKLGAALGAADAARDAAGTTGQRKKGKGR